MCAVHQALPPRRWAGVCSRTLETSSRAWLGESFRSLIFGASQTTRRGRSTCRFRRLPTTSVVTHYGPPSVTHFSNFVFRFWGSGLSTRSLALNEAAAAQHKKWATNMRRPAARSCDRKCRRPGARNGGPNGRPKTCCDRKNGDRNRPCDRKRCPKMGPAEVSCFPTRPP